MIYRDRDEYEEKEAGVQEDAVSELLDADEDDEEKVEVPEEEEEKWE
ncbi:MAG: hypothetical protein UY44_C0017G0007 [Candidatus Kaiserbacteria bacterium GW2011_GWA2_49_19]|uniref:Uncharacterized protein n=1 Tax=Candidatus Kaiserbacteria bacterium GW2011_GWA2_49_19 TaxID=1618669 RepID=A0A0G1YP76_9BACT|nr:MAG: hypothetical protein UY44_C0017G0007 [Candidatus Kaiserbacteria bacterium GW2011_GWA2_49_19]